MSSSEPPARRGGVLAIDLGTKRSGFAATDALRIALEPLAGCEAAPEDPRLLEHVAALLAEREIGTLLVGLPLNMDGGEGPAAAGARRFAARLAQRFTGIAVELADERLSSKEAEEWLREQGLRGPKARALRDAAAAAVILRDWIAGQAGAR